MPFGKTLLAALLGTSSLVVAPAALAQSALPQGGRTVAGTVAIADTGANTMTVTQTSTRAIVNWDSYSVGQNNTVRYVQPDAQAAILNRVTGTATSQIAGTITGNGQVYLINPNGIAITSTGSVRVDGGFVASSLDLGDADFLSGRLAFGSAGTSGTVSNAGTIAIGSGGYAALLGGRVANSGVISVPLGRIGLGAGEAATLDLTGDGFLQVVLPSAADGNEALLTAAGSLSGARIELRAASLANALRNAVNVPGQLAASGAHLDGGTIVIDSGLGSALVSGSLDASSTGAAGGKISLGGSEITLAGATLDASGATGGGSITIGGGALGAPVAGLTTADTVAIDGASTIRANSTLAGQGGNVVVWGTDQTTFEGAISARALGASGDGGNAEVSGHSLAYRGTTNLLAANGKTGNLLLDPFNVTISTGADAGTTGFAATATSATINTTTLQNALGTANVTVATGASGAEAGNITVANALSWSSGNALTLNAAGAITLTGNIDLGGGTLVLNANGGAISGAGNLSTLFGGAITFNVGSGTGTLTGVISGNGSVTKSGAGTLVLAGTNTYNGATTVSAGILKAGSTSAFGSNSAVNLADGATLDLAGNNISIGSLGSLGVAGTDKVTNSTAASAVTLTTGSNNFDSQFYGVIENGAGTMALAISGAGGFSLNGPSTFTGGTTISGSNYTIIHNAAALGTGTITINANSGLGVWLGGAGTVANAITINSAGVTGNLSGAGNNGKSAVYSDCGCSGPLTLSGTITLVNPASSIGGYILNNAVTITGQVTGTGGLAVNSTIHPGVLDPLFADGSDVVTLTNAANNYTGATQIGSRGRLIMGVANALPATSAVTIASGGFLDLNGFNTTIGSLAGAGTVTNDAATGVTLTAGGANTSTTFSGVLQNGSGLLGLSKSGSGQLTLSGANTFSGTAGVSAGTLSLSGSWTPVSGTATTTVASGATLSGAGAITATTLTTSGTGTVNLTGNNAVGTLSGSGTIGAITFNNNQSLALGSINAGSNAITITTTPASGANLTLNGGTVLTSTASGNAIQLAAAANFINNAGSGALSAASGRWLVYSAAPGTDTFGGLDSGNSALWNSTFGSSVALGGNRYLFAFQPTLTFTSTNANKTYGTVANLASAYSVSGLQAGVSGAFAADVAAGVFSGTPGLTSTGAAATATVAGGPYAITIGAGSLTSLTGYALAYQSSGLLSIDRAALTITGNTGSVTYNGVAQTNGFTTSTLFGSDAVSAVSGRGSGTAIGTYADTLSGATGTGLDNYTITYVNGGLTIGKATLTITGNTGLGTYTGLTQTNGFTTSPLFGTDAVSSVSGLGSGINAGTYADTLSGATGTGLNNYTITYVNGGLTIDRAPLSLTYTANSAASNYGAALAALSGSVAGTGFVNGEGIGVLGGTASWTTSATTASHVGSYAITGAGLTSGNYTITALQAAGNATAYTINPTGLTITANDALQSYTGAAFAGGNGIAFAGLVNGDTAASFSGSVTYGGSAQGAINRGTYAITASGLTNPDYAITWNPGTLTIGKATLTITGNTGSGTYTGLTQTNGFTTSPLFGTDAVASVSGLASGINAGTYADTLSGATGTGLDNYTITYVNGSLTIGKAALSLTYTANSAASTYGGPIAAMSGSVAGTGFVNGEGTGVLGGSASWATSATSGSNAGTYAITGSGLTSNNYTITALQAAGNATAYTIDKALLTLTYTANRTSSTYGGPLATVSGSVSGTGFVNGDGVGVLGGSATWTTSASAGNHVGSYAITGTGLTSGNYTITALQAAGNATAYAINPAALTVTALDAARTYDGTAYSGGNGYAISGLVNGDTAASLSGTVTYGGSAQGAVNAGSYAIAASGLANPDYAITYVNGTLTINKAALTLTYTANSAAGTYGGPIATMTGSVSGTGFVNGEGIGVLGGSATWTTNATTASHVGTYAITGTGVTSGNYAITALQAAGNANAYTVNPASLTITANDAARTYDGTAYSGGNGISLSGLVNGDTAASLAGSLTYGGSAQGAIDIGTYVITASGLTSSDYTISWKPGELRVVPASSSAWPSLYARQPQLQIRPAAVQFDFDAVAGRRGPALECTGTADGTLGASRPVAQKGAGKPDGQVPDSADLTCR